MGKGGTNQISTGENISHLFWPEIFRRSLIFGSRGGNVFLGAREGEWAMGGMIIIPPPIAHVYLYGYTHF